MSRRHGLPVLSENRTAGEHPFDASVDVTGASSGSGLTRVGLTGAGFCALLCSHSDLVRLLPDCERIRCDKGRRLVIDSLFSLQVCGEADTLIKNACLMTR